ncbi:MAG: tRNA (adenosine(37)-N6)-dimethylallyltransferase MiaA [Candidatus Methylomirabilales bacterium]
MKSAARSPEAEVPPVLILAGPTAVGKSALAMALAARTPAEVVAADSMQVYRGLDVGTAKPTAAERARVPHHLLDVREPWEGFSAAEFAAEAHRLVGEIRARGRLPILVGGTGLYLRAFLKGRLAPAPRDPALRARLHREAQAAGPAALHARLAALDAASAARIHPHDVVRLVRALEIHALTGRPPSSLRPALWDAPRTTVGAFLVLTRARDELQRLIDARCAAMWAGGLLDETRRLLAEARGLAARRLEAVGYRQAALYLEGRLGEEEALAAMQRATRAYAKRQMTWFRREPEALWVPVRGTDWTAALAAEILRGLAHPEARGAGWPSVSPGMGGAARHACLEA